MVNALDGMILDQNMSNGQQGLMGMKNIQQAPKKANQKRKTVPCVWYHSHVGCERGDNCDFIHDPMYKGEVTPNMHKYVRPIHK